GIRGPASPSDPSRRTIIACGDGRKTRTGGIRGALRRCAWLPAALPRRRRGRATAARARAGGRGGDVARAGAPSAARAAAERAGAAGPWRLRAFARGAEPERLRRPARAAARRAGRGGGPLARWGDLLAAGDPAAGPRAGAGACRLGRISSGSRRARYSLTITGLLKPGKRISPYRRRVGQSALLKTIVFGRWGA